MSPTDVWRLSDTYLRPQISDQFALGYCWDLMDSKIESSIEVYGKKLQNLVDFKVGADFLLNDQLETIVLQGPGKSYGLELSVKKSGRLSGWFNYTFARTLIKISGESRGETINKGKFFPTAYDKPHTINLVTNYKMTKRWSFSYNFNYSSGRPVTFPSGSYSIKGVSIANYSDRNLFRIPDYMRMDVGLSLDAGHKLKTFSQAYWSFSVYNVLGRNNPYSIFFDSKDNQLKGYKLIVFGNAIPTLSFNFKF